MRSSNPRLTAFGATALALSFALAGAVPVAAENEDGSVVVTTEVLGSVVQQLVGDIAEVTVIMPNGANPHGYEPSARDAERMLKADVLISNGLGLEEALASVLETAADEGVTWFQAADHISVLDVADGDHDEAADHDGGPMDPHIWTDPVAMIDVVEALEPVLAEAGIVASSGAEALITDLWALDAEVTEIVSVVPETNRELVTGHESLGYFADRYGFELVGTVIPGLSTNGEPTARELAQLIDDIRVNDVGVVFVEVGTPKAVAEAVATDSGARLVPLSTSQLPQDGEYQDLIRDIATTVAAALAE